MAIKLTSNYGLKKPEQDEFFDVGHQNGNMDVIDGAIKENADGISKLNQAATKTEKGLMSPADKAKLDGIEDKANNYIHPTNSGNKHMPAGGTAGQILQNTADGTAIWQDLEAAETRVSETVRALYGLTGENANVDKALALSPPIIEVVKKFTTSQAWTVPDGTTRADVYLVGGGMNGENGKQPSYGSAVATGGAGGKILHVTNFSVTPGTSVPVVVGANNGGDSSFGMLSTKNSNIFDTESSETSLVKCEGTGLICPFDRKVYGVRGASGGSVDVTSNGKFTRADAGESRTITEYGIGPFTGGKGVTARRGGGSGGGASANGNGGDAFDDGNRTTAGNGANASPNTGNGGGGGGSYASDIGYSTGTIGFGGIGGSGVVIIRYSKRGA